MGNANGKSYGQVSTFDEDYKDDNDADLTFVFHTTEDDCTDRVVHDNDVINDSISYTYKITFDDEVIAERNDYEGDNRIDDMLSLFNAGDAIEFITKDNQSHWVLYVGKNHCVHLIQDQVRKEDVRSIYKGCQVRIVNNVYVFKALPIVQILQNAESQVNNLSKWSNSECFTMWCRTNKNEFTSSYFAHKNLDDSSNNSKYTLSLKIDDESITKTFPSLSKLIEFRKKIELPFYKKLNYTSVTKS